ncbi:COG3173 Predicted aminoglycoside phosphotransferase [Fimbriimonadaceae bacterium]
MNAPWLGDFPIDLETARAVIRNQFPQLAQQSIRFLGSGWDNQAFLVDEIWVFRFPHRQLAVELINKECRWLPALAKQLPLPTSAPTWIGEPSELFPFPFAGSPFIPGESLDRALHADERLTHRIGDFLRKLHDVPIHSETPADDLRRADIPFRVELLRKQVSLGGFNSEDELATERAFEAALNARSAKHRTWVHGDLYPRHVIVQSDGEVSGIIDWGDLHVGDPALDVSIVFALLDPIDQEPFWSAYGNADPDLRIRAAFRALHYGIVLRSFGREASDEAIARTADRYLRSALKFFEKS